jgi:putative membrane protein
MMISAGIVVGTPENMFAQSQSQSKTGTKQTQTHSNHGANPNASRGANNASNNKTMGSKPADANFVKKASESNLAEIKLSELALQKASSAQVKEYAQMMIEHHTMAQTELASLVSNYTSNAGSRSGATGSDANDMGDADKVSTTGGTGSTSGNSTANGKTNGQYNSNSPEKDRAGADQSRNPSGGTTATGSTYSSGNAGGAVGTTGSTEGRPVDGTASKSTNRPGHSGGNNANTGKTNTANQADANATSNPNMSSTQVGRGQSTEPNNTSPVHGNDANNNENESDGTGGGGAGANSGGTTSSMTNGRISRTTPETQNDRQGQGTSTGTGDRMGSNVNTVGSAMKFDLPNDLSTEHKALRDKLARLSGAEFDKQYMQAMVKDHAKSVELFEKQAFISNEGDSQLKEYASKNLPLIKEHYEKAKSLSGNSGMNNNPSNKGSK